MRETKFLELFLGRISTNTTYVLIEPLQPAEDGSKKRKLLILMVPAGSVHYIGGLCVDRRVAVRLILSFVNDGNRSSSSLGELQLDLFEFHVVVTLVQKADGAQRRMSQ